MDVNQQQPEEVEEKPINIADVLHNSMTKNLTASRDHMMLYYADWRNKVSAGKVLVIVNCKSMVESLNFLNLNEFLEEQNYAVFSPNKLWPDCNELSHGERVNYLSILQRVAGETDFVMVLCDGSNELDFTLPIGMVLGRKPIVTIGEPLPMPYDTAATVHLNNDTEVAKFFELLIYKQSFTAFNSRLTAIAGYFKNAS